MQCSNARLLSTSGGSGHLNELNWAIPFNIHTPPMDGVFCFDNPQKITFTKDPSEISMDELNLLDTPQNYPWMKLFSLYTPQKCLWMKSFFLYTPQKCLWMRLFFLYTPQKCLWIRLFFLYASQKCLDEVMFLVYLSNMCTLKQVEFIFYYSLLKKLTDWSTIR